MAVVIAVPEFMFTVMAEPPVSKFPDPVIEVLVKLWIPLALISNLRFAAIVTVAPVNVTEEPVPPMMDISLLVIFRNPSFMKIALDRLKPPCTSIVP